jgi:hypothetical protein
MPRYDNRGIALIIVLLAMALMSALGVALVLATVAETHISAGFRRSQEALYAAEAGATRAIDDVRAVADWATLPSGAILSSFVDGAAGGTRRLDDGTVLDLTQALNLANCQKSASCTVDEMNAVTDDRPWGANNPRWNLFAYGPLRDMLPSGAIQCPYYVVVMIGDDPQETDDDPTIDGSPPNPGAGVIALRAEAFGPSGAHRVVELTLTRVGPVVRMLSWRELR